MKFLLVSLLLSLLSLSLGISGCSTTTNNKQEKRPGSTYKKSDLSKINKRHITYLKGVTAAKQGNYKTAVKYYRLAAKQGDYLAMNNLGASYALGRGVKKDQKKAFYWFSRILKPSSVVNYNIGLSYLNGTGVEKNYIKALQHFQNAMKKGHVGAINSIGYMYTNGLGVTQNKSIARQYYIEAATKGDSFAILNLGNEAYHDGKYREARQWYGKASRLDNKIATKQLLQMNTRGLY
jgi:TPR repeat protein